MSVGVGRVAAQAPPVGGLVLDQLPGPNAGWQSGLAHHVESPFGDRDLAERRRMDVIGHHVVARAEVPQVEEVGSKRLGFTRHDRIQLSHPGAAGPRTAEIVGRREGEHPVTATAELPQRGPEVGGKASRVPVRRAHVVDSDVQAAKLVASVRGRTAGGKGGELTVDHVSRAGSVLGVAGEGEPQSAGQPQRPGLQRHAPLQLAAAVGNRVPESEHAEAAFGFQRAVGAGQRARDYPLVIIQGVDSESLIPNDGSRDIAAAAAELAARIPTPLAPLAQLAYNYRWSWTPGGPELFRAVDPERFAACGQNPVRLLQEASAKSLAAAAADGALVNHAQGLLSLVQDELQVPGQSDPVAFLCAEYGIHVSLPIYSGGLGALAGDLVKEASDQALSMVAVGLMYRQGYFRQRIDASGWQHEYWVPTDPGADPGRPGHRRG